MKRLLVVFLAISSAALASSAPSRESLLLERNLELRRELVLFKRQLTLRSPTMASAIAQKVFNVLEKCGEIESHQKFISCVEKYER
jgi:hypothetical protein